MKSSREVVRINARDQLESRDRRGHVNVTLVAQRPSGMCLNHITCVSTRAHVCMHSQACTHTHNTHTGCWLYFCVPRTLQRPAAY